MVDRAPPRASKKCSEGERRRSRTTKSMKFPIPRQRSGEKIARADLFNVPTVHRPDQEEGSAPRPVQRCEATSRCGPRHPTTQNSHVILRPAPFLDCGLIPFPPIRLRPYLFQPRLSVLISASSSSSSFFPPFIFPNKYFRILRLK